MRSFRGDLSIATGDADRSYPPKTVGAIGIAGRDFNNVVNRRETRLSRVIRSNGQDWNISIEI